jgi:uncharacterized UPF0146 family protein
VTSSSRPALVSTLARHERLLEVGIGRRPAVAGALADRGRRVVGIDVAVSAAARRAAESRRHTGAGGSLRVVRADVRALAADDGDRERLSEIDGRRVDGDGDFREETAPDAGATPGFDAVYALRLPGELQRPTVALAERLGAACLFTTLGFEEPTVPVTRRSLPGTTLYVARGESTGDLPR